MRSTGKLAPAIATHMAIDALALFLQRGRAMNHVADAPDMAGAVDDEADDGMAIAGFWPRLLAWSIDVVLLCIVSFAIAWLFMDQMMRLGGWSHWLGMGAVILYFGLMNSRLCDGQTAGKILMDVRVVDRHGARLGVRRSLLRTLVFWAPSLASELPLPAAMSALPWQMLLALLVYGGWLAISYLYLFNARTRQSLHDLATGTLVVREQPESGTPPQLSPWRGHWIVLAAIACLALSIPLMLGRMLQQPQMQEVARMLPAILAEPGVLEANVGTYVFKMTGQPPQRSLRAVVRVRDKAYIDKAFAERIYQRMRHAQPQRVARERVVVQLWWGFDLGIAKWSQSLDFVFVGEEAPATQ